MSLSDVAINHQLKNNISADLANTQLEKAN